MNFTLSAIGTFHCDKVDPFDAAHQPTLDLPSEQGYIQLLPGMQFDYALQDLNSFSHIWILFIFHRNSTWKPKVQPPRGSSNKRGVFSTRSPYRPNFIGMSCVKLEKIENLKVWISGFDILDQTPIVDIKPYLPYSDIVPEANMGWLDGIPEFQIEFSSHSLEQLSKADAETQNKIKFFIQTQLRFDPDSSKQKRIKLIQESPKVFELAYKFHRIEYKILESKVLVTDIYLNKSS